MEVSPFPDEIVVTAPSHRVSLGDVLGAYWNGIVHAPGDAWNGIVHALNAPLYTDRDAHMFQNIHDHPAATPTLGEWYWGAAKMLTPIGPAIGAYNHNNNVIDALGRGDPLTARYEAEGAMFDTAQVAAMGYGAVRGAGAISAEMRAGAAAENGTVTLYRVDDAAFPPRISADGSVPVVTTRAGGERALFVNIGQPERAAEFALVNRGGQATITAVEVDASLLETLRNTAVWDRSDLAALNPTAPLRVDITAAPDQFGLRTPEQIQMLRDAIQPGTARVVDPRSLLPQGR